MMRRIVNASLRFRVLVAVAAAGILVFGVIQLRDAPADIYPEFVPTYVEVQTEALGLSAEEVEQLITVPLEADLLNGVAWLNHIRSESLPGLSAITLVFEPGTDLYRARQVVQERLAQAHAIPNVSKPPQMLQPVSSTSRTMMIGLSSEEMSLIDISQLTRWTIKPRLMGVEGVANVSVFGHRERQLQVLVDPARLSEAGVSLSQVVETTGNALWVSPLTFLEASTPGTGGFIESPTQRLGVQHVSPIESADDLAQVAVEGTAGEAGSLRLGDIATVVEDHQLLIGDAALDGDPGILLVVEKLPGANTVEVTERVEAAIDTLRPGLEGLEIDTSIFRPADYINSGRANVGKALLAGLALAIVALSFAFYHWRTALVSATTMLVSLGAAGLVVYLRGATFNNMVVAGLAVALGVVVDDVVTGTAHMARRLRERTEGQTPAAAILSGTLEVRGALVYATLFILLPVLPVFFMGDLFGAFGRPLAVTYALAVLASMATALLLTPALGLILLGGVFRRSPEPGFVTRLGRSYTGALERLLRTRRPVFLLAGGLALVGLLVLPQIRRSELPSLRERDFLVELEAAPGTSLPAMQRLTNATSSELRSIPGVRSVASHVGRAVTSDQLVDVNVSELWISIDASADYGATVGEIREVAGGYAGLDVDVLTYQEARIKESRTGADEPLVVRVYGQELDVLTDKATEVRAELASVDGITNLKVETPVSEPTLEVQVDLERAQRLGIKPGDVRRAAATLISSLEVGQLFYDQKVFEVVVWGAPETRENLADVRDLLIDLPEGGQVRLEDVADVRVTPVPDVIEREGVFRRIDVTAGISGRDRGAVVADVEAALEGIEFPLEYRAELLGTYAAKQAAQRRLAGLGVLAAAGMLLLLQACFGSWRLGALFFLTLPVALVGGALAAFAAGGTLTIGTALGLLAVLAVAARNGILLIRRYQHMERRENATPGLAVVIGGARERLAPTLATALATALLFLPFAVLGPRPGFEILHPMAVVILGGLATATLVNLFVVPGLHLAFGKVESETELDLRRFEEELAAEHGEGRPANGAPAPAPLTGTPTGA